MLARKIRLLGLVPILIALVGVGTASAQGSGKKNTDTAEGFGFGAGATDIGMVVVGKQPADTDAKIAVLAEDKKTVLLGPKKLERTVNNKKFCGDTVTVAVYSGAFPAVDPSGGGTSYDHVPVTAPIDSISGPRTMTPYLIVVKGCANARSVAVVTNVRVEVLKKDGTKVVRKRSPLGRLRGLVAP